MSIVNVNFTPIDRKDCEVFRTVALLSRMPERRENLRETLRMQNERINADIHSKLAYGLFNLLANNSKDVLESKINVENALTAFEEILEMQPNYWLAKMYKIRILLMLPSSFRDEEEIIDEISEMIEQQKDGDYYPYYVIPYLLMAGLYWSIGEEDKAQQYILEAERQVIKPIKMIPDFLVIIFEDLENKLSSSGDHEMSHRIIKMKQAFFRD